MPGMETVGIRELKDRLSKYVRQVETGDVVIITDRGRVVAELVPPGRDPRRAETHPGLLELERRGQIRLGVGKNRPELYPTMSRVDLGGLTVQDLIDWERGDR